MSLSRAEMERTIAQGGSVLYQGRIISRAQDLPSEADLARGDPDAEAQTQTRLEAQIAELQAQVQRLQGGERKAATSAEKDKK